MVKKEFGASSVHDIDLQRSLETMNFRTVSDMTNLIMNKLYIIPSDVDLVVGIPRSGLLAANYIALLMNKPMTDVDGLINNRVLSSGRTKNTSANISSVDECRKILVIDDSISSGVSMDECRAKLRKIDIDAELIFCAIYALPSSKSYVDIYFEVLPAPRLFEWNVFHQSSMLERMCFDIDGVLCKDPEQSENDDGIKYSEFIKNVPTKIVPTGKIGYLVTSRLKKYKNETETWMKKNGIQYTELVMLDATAEERRINNMHASFKAEFYKKSDAILFIESEKKQAIEINNISHKPVFCIEDGMFYGGNKIYELRYESISRLKDLLRRFKVIRLIYKAIRK